MDVKNAFIEEFTPLIDELKRITSQIEANLNSLVQDDKIEGIEMANWFIHAQIGQLRQTLKGMNNRSYYYGRLFVKKCKEKHKQNNKDTAENET